MLRRKTSFQYGVPMLRILDKPVSGWAALTKYCMDYTLGSLFLVLSLPIILTAAICIKLESRGPIFFRQQRYGFNSQLIDIFKFRTMYVDQTDAAADKLATRDDPRITKVGAFLRRFSLDELPQLFNVLRGEMSVVGPRPHALRAKAGGKLYKDVIDEYAVRYKVKPGITGWAQVNGWRGNTETERDLIGRIEHDLHYIEHWSIPLDLSIIMRTVTAVIGGKNSY
jgi:exopolysaccharide biosynthesis polyprenyl glycosylphosphotransferase